MNGTPPGPGPSAAGTTVTAEWALWGKDRGDRGYRLLQCSAGAVSRENFEELLTRFLPGTPESLPQVTISWISDRTQTQFLAIAIHDWAAHEAARRAARDASGRGIMLTRYFCVPWHTWAATAISYPAMYETFCAVPLPDDSRDRITRELVPVPAAGPPGAFAMEVAALLLTGRPVCILGAGQVEVGPRLRFLDEVMSLLPYGMRSRLAASTWASSTFQEHRIRLYFASARRPGDDLPVTWQQPASRALGHPEADRYLAWLRSRPGARAELAAATEQLGFAPDDVRLMLDRLPRLAGPPRPAAREDGAPAPEAQAQAPRSASAEDLILACAQEMVERGGPIPDADVTQLEQHAALPPAAHARCWSAIRDWGLLGDKLPLPSALLVRYYTAMVRLAFPAPLSYPNFCEIEASLGQPEVLPHLSLLRALDQCDVADLRMCLLMAGAAGTEHRPAARSERPGKLIAAAADPALPPHHARAVCDAALDLLGGYGHLDRPALQAACRDHDQLAPVLQARYPDDPGYQVDVLQRLLGIAYGTPLDHPAITDILAGRGAPSVPLLAAVLLLADPADAGLVARTHARRLIAAMGLTGPAGVDLVNRLSGGDGGKTRRTGPNRPARLGKVRRRGSHEDPSPAGGAPAPASGARGSLLARDSPGRLSSSRQSETVEQPAPFVPGQAREIDHGAWYLLGALAVVVVVALVAALRLS